MEDDLFPFIHRLHFNDINENETNPDQSLLKPKSTWTVPFTKNKEFENLSETYPILHFTMRFSKIIQRTYINT